MGESITYQQLLELIKPYEGIILWFKDYYKYSFSFETEVAYTPRISLDIGGCHEDIYRFEVKSDKPYTLGELSKEPVSRIAINGEEYYVSDL